VLAGTPRLFLAPLTVEDNRFYLQPSCPKLKGRGPRILRPDAAGFARTRSSEVSWNEPTIALKLEGDQDRGGSENGSSLKSTCSTPKPLASSVCLHVPAAPSPRKRAVSVMCLFPSPRGPRGRRRGQCALSKHHLCSTVAVPGSQIDATASASRYHGFKRNLDTPAVRFHWRQAVRNGMQTKAASTVPFPANHEAEPPCRAASGSAIPIAVAHPFLSRRSFVILARRSRPLF